MLFILLIYCQPALSAPVVKKSIPGDWVLPIDIAAISETPSTEIQDGQHYLLVDTQVRVAEGAPVQHYRHFAIEVANPSGMEATSQISFVFNPAYQKASLHSLVIRRQGKLLDRLPAAEIQLFRREKDLDALIYDGRYTANVIVDDVRVGDVIEYAYTISGTNPIFHNIFSYTLDTNWSVPVNKNYFRLIWPKSRKIFERGHNTDLTLVRRDQGDSIIFSLLQKKVPPVRRNTQVPDWFRRYGYIQLSEMKNWAKVVEWALPLYRPAYQGDSSTAKLIATIGQSVESDPERAIWALNYIQNSIRYLGIELGINSHQPSPPGDTFERRYGDCKDKTVALIALLTRLGVEAYPALVNTSLNHQLDTLHPTIRAFNHVIARVLVDGKAYWLDPTLKYQGHSLENVFQPNYGVALVIAPGETNLTRMPSNDHLRGVHIEDKFDVQKGFSYPASYTVKSTYRGFNAEDLRYRMAEEGRSAVEEDYLNYYTKYYEKIEKADAIQVDDDLAQNELRLHENYRITDFWEKDEADGRWEGTFYTNALYPYLKKPKQRQRHEPFHIDHPVNIRQTIRVQLSEPWDIQATAFTERNAHFKFTSRVSYDDGSKTLQLDYHYRSFKDFVTPQELAEYLAALDRVDDELDYYLSNPLVDAAPTRAKIWLEWLQARIYLVIFALLLAYCLLEWWWDARKPATRENGFYYAVSLSKFIVLFLATLGLYEVFWFYRNWQYVKQRDNSDIMPFWRAVFSVFWFYPFYQDLKRDSQQRYGRSMLPKPYWIILLLILLVGLGVGENLGDAFEYLNLLGVICFLPFTNYILLINEKKSDSVISHSCFRLRHFVLGAMATVLLLFHFGSLLYWIPNGEVVKGHQLPSWELKFMQREGLLQEDARLLFFYSNDFLFMRNDGNGVTDTNVFSYWHEKDSSILSTKSTTFDDIDDINVQYAESKGEDTIITIIPKNGSSFILYASSENGNDKLFVQAIRDRLKNV